MKMLQTSMCCLFAAALLVHSGCAKKKSEKTGKSIETNLDAKPVVKSDNKSESAKTIVKKSGNPVAKGNGTKTGNGTKQVGKTPIQAVKPIAKNNGGKKTVNPPIGPGKKKKVETGSTTVRKIRGPKIGDQD